MPASLLMVAAVVAGGCGRRSEQTAESAPAVSVNTIQVQSTTTTADAEVPGTVRAVREARLAAKIMSKVVRVTVNEGDRVRRGQVLVKLDDKDLRAQLARASAALQAARAGHDQAQTAL
ncbi:MAG: biotin/lipoyl-binding protein, partial [Armatimonadetes bacterium]|nr:biotin/lipoyl-binding protein [Armatimonadota bacterium]